MVVAVSWNAVVHEGILFFEEGHVAPGEAGGVDLLFVAGACGFGCEFVHCSGVIELH